MTKIAVETTAIIEIMRRDESKLTEETRAAIAALCRVDEVSDLNLPDAIKALRDRLPKYIPWLDRAMELIEESQMGCWACVIDHDDVEKYLELCPMVRVQAALVALFGQTIEIEPLRVGAYRKFNPRWN